MIWRQFNVCKCQKEEEAETRLSDAGEMMIFFNEFSFKSISKRLDRQVKDNIYYLLIVLSN